MTSLRLAPKEEEGSGVELLVSLRLEGFSVIKTRLVLTVMIQNLLLRQKPAISRPYIVNFIGKRK